MKTDGMAICGSLLPLWAGMVNHQQSSSKLPRSK